MTSIVVKDTEDTEHSEYNETSNKEELIRELTILRQISREYKEAEDFMKPKISKWLRRLKLYNNQGRKDSKVGDPLLFTVFQTVFSALYYDKLSVEWEATEIGDEETAENLTYLSEHDFRVMEKADTDYDWDWNTCFYGRGLVLLTEWNREKSTPIPEVIDPLTWLRDPEAVSVNGNSNGVGAMRYGGREIYLTKREMEERGFENLDCLKLRQEKSDVNREAEQARTDSQGRGSVFQEENGDEREDSEYPVLQWFTHIDGEKMVVYVSRDAKKILKEVKVEGEKWHIIDRTLFPMAHDWDGVSIPDLIEDKQRARAKLINLGLDGAVMDTYPMYLYNKKKIKSKGDLDFAFGKAIGVDGSVDGAYQPFQKASSFSQNVDHILGILDTASQKAVAAPEIAQGVTPMQQRTLGEQEMVAAARGARMSVAAGLWGRSEEKFWNQWYWMYKKYFKADIDEKVIRIRGSLYASWRKLTRENLICDADPDVYVVSKREKDTQRNEDLARLQAITQMIMQDPQANRRYITRKMLKTAGISNDEIYLIYPPTPDEILAEDENEQLNEGRRININPTDDHIAHLEIHMRANRTPATLAHIYEHKVMIQLMKQSGLPPTETMSAPLEAGGTGGYRPIEQMVTPEEDPFSLMQ